MASVSYQDYIKINKLIEIEINMDKGTMEQTEVFASRVEDMRKDAIMVAAPYKKGTVVPVPVGEEVQIRIGKDGTYYLFHSKVVGRIAGHQPVLQLSLPFKITKIQMRNWVRVDTNLPVLYRLAGSEDEFIEANAIDISGGGICMLTQERIQKETQLEVEIKFPDNFLLKTNGIVTRCVDENKIIRIGVCFQDINERHQERIVGYVFKKQREHIKKGVGKTPLR